MESKELRIGNLVNETKLKIVKITPELLCDFAFGYYNFQPIQLTEEWLLKFGAKELKPKRGILKEFVLKTIRVEMSNSGNFYYKNSKVILDSVHQLQNLYFALTQKELVYGS